MDLFCVFPLPFCVASFVKQPFRVCELLRRFSDFGLPSVLVANGIRREPSHVEGPVSFNPVSFLFPFRRTHNVSTHGAILGVGSEAGHGPCECSSFETCFIGQMGVSFLMAPLFGMVLKGNKRRHTTPFYGSPFLRDTQINLGDFKQVVVACSQK